MSLLAALVRAYESLPKEDGAVPPPGYSSEKISFVIGLALDGTPVSVSDIRQGKGKKLTPRRMTVPQPVKRTSGIAPNFLWDKTAYVLGVTAGAGKRTSEEHAAFVASHQKALAETSDPGLLALLAFLQRWSPEAFEARGWSEDLKDQNVVFALESERLSNVFLHDRPAARALWAQMGTSDETPQGVCLVTGERGPITRLHPALKNVWGGQSSGVTLVSYNKEAFDSYGHKQGANAPVSEAAAFAYGTALNLFLQPDSGHRLQIGDTTTVFWAEAEDPVQAAVAEKLFLGMHDALPGLPDDEEEIAAFADVDLHAQARKVGSILERLRAGQPLASFAPELADGVRFHVLGLAPNAARVAVRFWLEDTFGALETAYRRYIEDTRLSPTRDPYPPLWRYLRETAVLGKQENVPPALAGDLARAILSGGRYPQSLSSTVLMRLRADGEVSDRRVALLKAVLRRNHHKEPPVSLDPTFTETGYLLGRLFAAYESIQSAALGPKVNATIRDKYYGAASAQPRKVFPSLTSNAGNHLSKISKKEPEQRDKLEENVEEIMELLDPRHDPFPAALSAEQQAYFALGYYHQRNK